MAARNYFALSNFGTHYFLEDFVDSDTVPASVQVGTNEFEGIISCSSFNLQKNTQKYNTLDGNGWESVVALGNQMEDLEFEAIRLGTGNVYNGTAGTSTFTLIEEWFMGATAGAGNASPKTLIEIIPRGAGTEMVYEATAFNVIPKAFNGGAKNTDDGQLFNFTLSPFGPPHPCTVEFTPKTDTTPATFKLTKIS